MFEEIAKGLALRDLIVEMLRDGPRSISQVGKALHERGLKIHRLAVAGYLKALADSGALDEREIPPAKVYALRPGPAQRDLYVAIAARCREAVGEGPDASRLFLQVLNDLFRRPIFREEFRRGGIEPARDAQEAEGDERQAARRFLSRSALKLPFNDPAYHPRVDDARSRSELHERSQGVLAQLVREEYHAGALAVTTKQSTLGGVD